MCVLEGEVVLCAGNVCRAGEMRRILKRHRKTQCTTWNSTGGDGNRMVYMQVGRAPPDIHALKLVD